MTGLQVQQILKKNGYILNEIGRKLGETPQNFNASLKVRDIKTGTLERIAEAIGKPVTFFYGDSAQVANANGDNNTTIVGNNITNNDTPTLETMLARKDEQLARSQEQIDRLLGIIETMNKRQ